jgi:hypothetical protein
MYRTKHGFVLPEGVDLDKPVNCDLSAPALSLEEAFMQVLGIGLGARGFNTQGDVLTQTIDGRDLNEMWNDFVTALNAFNARRSAIVDILSFGVSQPVEDVPQVAGDDFEEASEFGLPKKIRGGAFFSLAYDFKWYDIGIGFTWQYLAEAQAAQVDSLNNMVFEADNRLVFSRVLKRIFNNTGGTTSIRQNTFNVYPFYNGDATVPPPWKTTVHTAPHNHYLALGVPPLTSADLDAMEDHLKHHGYGRQNGSRLVMLVNPAEIAVIRNFRVATGSSYDFIPATGQPPWLLPSNVGGVVIPQGAGIPANIGGIEVAGRYGSWLICEEDYIPAGYLLGFATGGDNNATNPVGIREHQNAGLRGLRLVKGRDPDYPLVDSYYQHGLGTGVRHRGAGVVGQLAASYTIPTAYV